MVAGTGFDTDLPLAEDVVLLARLLAAADLGCVIPRTAAGAVYYRTTRRNPQLPRLPADHLLDAFARVAELPRSAALNAARPDLRAAGVAEVNRYLRTHPDDHRAVIAQRRRDGLNREVDLRRLNDGVACDLAVLYLAVPYVDTSANVAARRILVRERLVDVVSCDMSSDRAVDASADQIWAEFVDRRVEVAAKPHYIWWPGVTEFCRKALPRIEALERAKGPYRTLYSRAMHPTSHFLAALVKIRRPGITWTAELSDPVRDRGPR